MITLLDDFARLHRLPIDFGVGVERIERVGDRWEVGTAGGRHVARHVIIATGRDRLPHMPDWPGRDGFTGRLLHSADFGEARDFVGQSVLMVGAGNSGFDILNHLVRVKTGPMWLSARHGPAILPKRIINIAVHKISPLLSALPTWLADAVIAATQRVMFGSRARLGLPAAAGGGVSRLTAESVALTTDDGTVAAIRAGRIKVVPPIRGFDRDQVVLEDGTVLKPDVVIAATGYRSGLEPMLGHLGVLNERGQPLFNGGESRPDLPGLWFTGMRPDLRGCFTHSRLQAAAIAAAIVRAR